MKKSIFKIFGYAGIFFCIFNMQIGKASIDEDGWLAEIADNTGATVEILNIIEDETKNIETSTDRIENFSEEIKKFTESIDSTTSEHWEAMKNTYNMSSKTDDPFEFSFNSFNFNAEYPELWSDDEWNNALLKASGNNTERFNELKAAYAESNPTLDENDISAIDSDILIKNGYTKLAKTTNMALAASEYTYHDVNQRVRNLEHLIQIIDDSSKNANEKAAIDLNSRLIAEVGLIQIEMLRLQSIQSQVQASEQQDMLNHNTIEKQMLGYNIKEEE